MEAAQRPVLAPASRICSSSSAPPSLVAFCPFATTYQFRLTRQNFPSFERGSGEAVHEYKGFIERFLPRFRDGFALQQCDLVVLQIAYKARQGLETDFREIVPNVATIPGALEHFARGPCDRLMYASLVWPPSLRK